jgi:hypothetical protein
MLGGRPGNHCRPGRGPPPPLHPGPRAPRPVTHRRRGLRREEAEEAEEVPPLRGDPRARPEVPPPPALPGSPAPPARKRKSRPFPRRRRGGWKEKAAAATACKLCACALSGGRRLGIQNRFRWDNGTRCACALCTRFLGHRPHAPDIRLRHALGASLS